MRDNRTQSSSVILDDRVFQFWKNASSGVMTLDAPLDAPKDAPQGASMDALEAPMVLKRAPEAPKEVVALFLNIY